MTNEPSKSRSLPTFWIIAIFVLVLISYSFFNLPVSLLGSRLQESGVTYSDISGSFWKARLRNPVIMDRSWQSADIEISKLPILFGGVDATFSLQSRDAAANGVLTIEQDDLYQLKSLQGISEITFNHNGQVIPANISFSSENLMINARGECQQGTLNLKSDILDHLLADFNIQMPALTGQGECSGAISTIVMTSEQNGITVTYRGEHSGDRQRNMVSITLPSLMDNNPQVTARLRSFGFEKNGNMWQGAATIGML